jgi:glycosyltransferase involved in cell wall biosynthesis
MRILLANYRYFVSGGPERYMFNVSRELTARGHDIIPFSIRYAQNLATRYEKYFVSPLGTADEVYFEQHRRSLPAAVKTVSRLFYSSEVENAVGKLADDTRPDVAYVLHYLRKLSPSLLAAIKKRTLPLVVRLSDYAMLCPQAHFLREEKPCTLCKDGGLLASVRHRCVKGSMTASLLNLIATWYHRFKGYFDLIDAYVCTNQFMYQMMLEAGVPESRLACIPTFTDTARFSPDAECAKGDYLIYSGRLSPVKGVHILIEAMARLKDMGFRDARLKIVGAGEPGYVRLCREKIEALGLASNVELLGNVPVDTLQALLRSALLSVVPSLWFENLPNVILESYASGTPVIASNVGSLSETVADDRTGYLFSPGDPADLAEKMKYSLSDGNRLRSMAVNARNEALQKYSPENHLTSLLDLFGTMSKGRAVFGGRGAMN